jgi:hypothetical protein
MLFGFEHRATLQTFKGALRILWRALEMIVDRFSLPRVLEFGPDDETVILSQTKKRVAG